MSTEYDKIKKTEEDTLKTFQKENPSQYFSHLNKSAYLRYLKMVNRFYTEYLKLPPKIFDSTDIIDFGAGTGDNTLHLARWGANCTLVEMNHLALNIAKKLFLKYAKKSNKHKFILSSIFVF